MTKVSELFEYSIANEQIATAHAIFWAISNNLVATSDDSEKLTTLTYDKAAVAQLTQSNVLGLGTIKLYIIECKNNWYAFYFAQNVLELASLHRSLFNQEAGKIVEAKRLLNKLFSIDGEEQFLLDYRKQVLSYPAYIGHAKANSNIMTRFESVVKKVV
jgi:hypothetical protein